MSEVGGIQKGPTGLPKGNVGNRTDYGGRVHDALGPMAGRKCRCKPGCPREVRSHNRDGIHSLCVEEWRKQRAMRTTFG